MLQIGGTCLLTRGIVLAVGRKYVGGATTGTVLKQHGPMSFVLASSAYVGNSTTTGDPIQIRDLTVACDGSGSTDGIIIMNWQTVVQQVDIHHCGGSGIVNTSVAQNGRAITNTSVNSRFEDNFITNSGNYGIEVVDPVNAVTDGFVTDNQIANSRKDGIYLQNSAGWVISGNHLYGDGEDGIHAERLHATTISDNYVEDFGAARRSGTWYGIAGSAQGGVGSAITANKVFNDTGEQPGARYVYIAVTMTNFGTGYLSVSGNVIATVVRADEAFYFNGAPHALVVASAANQVSGPGTPRTLGRAVTLRPGI
ncbi:MAG TPA: right-handed parallel beta-helix repeat-containing protein [Streptosporangiaceae bacterium]|nr:right-handed parallel beta-helix repeat-containing protein [Streptosporangiaceae bacterium]